MAKKRGEEQILDVNASMQGNMVFSDPVNLRINGKFEGMLNTKGNLIIGEQAQVNAEIIGENIMVAGKVRGKIKATKMLAFNATAEVFADVETPKIAIEEGAVFNGKCKMPQDKMLLPELSEYLSIEEDTLKEWVSNERIPVHKEGEELLFDRAEVEEWISSKK
ncbi:MAG: polymer-forming cytoskeletal protein [Candidatus Omnitrophota bacterium]|nr:polymer-forming cytoskeletal protein [Candidatus Omnitrophota bacterium]